MPKHAVLSASSAGLWIACPGSQHMRAVFPQEQSSVAADEGTLAHALAAIEIERATLGEEFNGELNEEILAKELSETREKIDKFYADHIELGDSYDIMQREIAPYVDYVLAELGKAKEISEDATLATEQHVDFSDYVPGGFGTSDVIIAAGDRIEIIDLKYGKGVPVSAVNNPQIRLYALGSIALYSMLYEFKTAKVVIYQPRLDSVTEEEISVEDLEKWGREVVAPKAAEALSDSPSYHPGDWCQNKFCPGAAVCKARADYILKLEKLKGKDPALLSREEIGDALSRIDALMKWAKKIQTFSLDEISQGRPIPGWKIVEGRSIRAFSDEEKAAAAAIKAGYDESLIYERKMITLSAMEKLMGKKEFNRIEGALVTKPEGKPTLAPESDKRPAFTPSSNIENFDE